MVFGRDFVSELEGIWSQNADAAETVDEPHFGLQGFLPWGFVGLGFGKVSGSSSNAERIDWPMCALCFVDGLNIHVVFKLPLQQESIHLPLNLPLEMAVAHGRRREGFTKRLKGGSASMTNMMVPVLQSHSRRVLQLNALPDHLVVLVHGILGRYDPSLCWQTATRLYHAFAHPQDLEVTWRLTRFYCCCCMRIVRIIRK